jgi:eukaryotic-like serine/threonine-protein kinase
MASVFHRLGPYEIVKEIGRGGMAVVFLARDTRNESRVALKLVPQGTDREAREILEAEQWGAELQQQFCQVSPHVPFVYEHGLESSYFYVAMEYLDGENLSDVISRGPVPVERAIEMTVELCRFLEDAHRFEATIGERQLRRLLHGDLKPRNVRITPDGQVKVLDFGIAKALSLSRKVTRNDFGSMAYLSPERLESGEVDAYADYWAVGVLLHEMLSGSAPFQAPDTHRLEKLILSRCPPPPLDGGCPVPVQAVVAKLLAPDPGARYGDAQGIREDLERAMSGQPTMAEGDGWPARAHDESPTKRTRPPLEVEPDATRRTTPPPIPPLPLVIPPIPASIAPTPPRKKRRWARRLVPLVLVIMVLGNIANEMSVAADAVRLAASIPTRGLDQIADAWKEHDRLAERSSLGFGVRALGRTLSDHTEALANLVVENYRSPLPSVREAQWRATRAALARAVAVSPRDHHLRALLRYCDGHLHRINGEARKARKQASAQQELSEAVRAFREAAELRPGWPDPFLGLARTFIYGLEDVDRGADALAQAEKNGYTPADRETAQLGDGYRLRGETLARNARHVSGLSQEHDYLARAADAYRQAIAHYSRAGDYADVPRNLGVSQRRLEQVMQRISELDGSPVKEPLDSDPPAPPLLPRSADRSSPGRAIARRVPETR